MLRSSSLELGLFLSAQGARRQLATMPCELYLIRLIDSSTPRPFPGERLWTTAQLCHPTAVRFLHARNREGCEIDLQPYASHQNAGYILVRRGSGAHRYRRYNARAWHEPGVVLQTSPGHQQA
jgi:hypothetical protein